MSQTLALSGELRDLLSPITRLTIHVNVDPNLAPLYRHHPDIQEGLEKDASEDKFSGEFWV